MTDSFYSPEESSDWLSARMKNLHISSLENLAKLTEIDRGTLSRYFHQERRPSVDVVAPLCKALQVSPNTLLKVLGAIHK